MEQPNYTLCELESDKWRLVKPLILWTFHSGAGYTVGDHGPFQMIGLGDTFDEARDDYCRNLIDAVEYTDRKDKLFTEWLQPIHAACQDWQVTATGVQDVTLDVTDCTQGDRAPKVKQPGALLNEEARKCADF